MTEPFTKIPNLFLERIACTTLSPYETRILAFIIRMTWGWHKDTDTIALRQFSDATGIDRRNAHRTVRRLEVRRIIVISRCDRQAASYRINDNFLEWDLSPLEERDRRMRRHKKIKSAQRKKTSSITPVNETPDKPPEIELIDAASPNGGNVFDDSKLPGR